MLETEITKLIKAVEALTAVMGGAAAQPTTIAPEVINPTATPATTGPQTTTPQAAIPQTTAPVDTQGVTPDSLKAKASDLARRLGPRAVVISEKLKELGTDRLSGLTQTNFVAFDLWLNAEIAQLTNGAG